VSRNGTVVLTGDRRFWIPGKEVQEHIVAVFRRPIQNGCNLIGAEELCSSYETTFAHFRNSARSSGEVMYDLWLTDYQTTPWDLNVELALNQRLRIDHATLKEDKGIVIVRGSWISAIVLDPPPDLRRVELRLISRPRIPGHNDLRP
jgi:hypothetical protein